jgi:energy-converting hydrogenase Eha subunit G
MKQETRGFGAFSRSQSSVEYCLLLGCLLTFFFLPLKALVPAVVVGTGVLIRVCNTSD